MAARHRRAVYREHEPGDPGRADAVAGAAGQAQPALARGDPDRHFRRRLPPTVAACPDRVRSPDRPALQPAGVRSGGGRALVFEDGRNRLMAGCFEDRREAVFYDAENLEPLLEHYLTHDDQRRGLAEAGRAKAPSFAFERLWASVAADIERDWAALVERARDRPRPGRTAALTARLEQAMQAPQRSDPCLVRDLERAATAEPNSAELANALGVALLAVGPSASAAVQAAEVAAGHFRQARTASPGHWAARLNLATALETAGAADEAVAHARAAVAALARGAEPEVSLLNAPLCRADYGTFRMEWERAAWEHAGRPRAEARAKHALLRWHWHAALGKANGELLHQYEAFLARPDLLAAAAALS